MGFGSFFALLQAVILFAEAEIDYDIMLVHPRVPAGQVKRMSASVIIISKSCEPKPFEAINTSLTNGL